MSSIITLSLVGLLVGFVFSMPIAGPISILVTSNALKGRVRYCRLAAIGSSLADFIYVFCAVFGMTRFFTFLQPLIPYVLLVGMAFLFYLGYKISHTKIDLEHITSDSPQQGKKGKNGFLTGFLLNLLNPTLFFSWLTSSFIVISLVSSFGLNTGGLEQSVDKSFNTMNKKGADDSLRKKAFLFLHLDTTKQAPLASAAQASPAQSEYFSLLSSAMYAFSLSVGGLLWFFYLAHLLAKNRYRVNIRTINFLIRSLGWALYLFAGFLGYHAVTLFRG